MKKNRKGITLVEEMVSLLILSILILVATGFIITGFRLYANNVITESAQSKAQHVYEVFDEKLTYAAGLEISNTEFDESTEDKEHGAVYQYLTIENDKITSWYSGSSETEHEEYSYGNYDVDIDLKFVGDSITADSASLTDTMTADAVLVPSEKVEELAAVEPTGAVAALANYSPQEEVLAVGMAEYSEKKSLSSGATLYDADEVIKTITTDFSDGMTVNIDSILEEYTLTRIRLTPDNAWVYCSYSYGGEYSWNATGLGSTNSNEPQEINIPSNVTLTSPLRFGLNNTNIEKIEIFGIPKTPTSSDKLECSTESISLKEGKTVSLADLTFTYTDADGNKTEGLKLGETDGLTADTGSTSGYGEYIEVDGTSLKGLKETTGAVVWFRYKTTNCSIPVTVLQNVYTLSQDSINIYYHDYFDLKSIKITDEEGEEYDFTSAETSLENLEVLDDGRLYCKGMIDSQYNPTVKLIVGGQKLSVSVITVDNTFEVTPDSLVTKVKKVVYPTDFTITKNGEPYTFSAENGDTFTSPTWNKEEVNGGIRFNSVENNAGVTFHFTDRVSGDIWVPVQVEKNDYIFTPASGELSVEYGGTVDLAEVLTITENGSKVTLGSSDTDYYISDSGLFTLSDNTKLTVPTTTGSWVTSGTIKLSLNGTEVYYDINITPVYTVKASGNISLDADTQDSVDIQTINRMFTITKNGSEANLWSLGDLGQYFSVSNTEIAALTTGNQSISVTGLKKGTTELVFTIGKATAKIPVTVKSAVVKKVTINDNLKKIIQNYAHNGRLLGIKKAGSLSEAPSWALNADGTIKTSGDDITNRAYDCTTTGIEGEEGHFYAWWDVKSNPKTNTSDAYLYWYTDADIVYMPVNCEELFKECKNEKFTEFDLSEETTGVKFSFEKTTTIRRMFRECSNLESIDLSCLTSAPKLTNMTTVFENCNKLTEVNLSSFTNAPKVETTAWMFKNSGVTSVNLSGITTLPKLTNMTQMFYGCANLKTVNFSGLTNMDAMVWENSSKDNGFYQMFNGCTNLETVNFSKLASAAKLQSMNTMFEGCAALTEVNLSKLTNLPALKTTEYMFKNCKALTKIDLSGLSELKELKSMQQMFYGCTSLSELKLDNLKSTPNLTNIANWFGDGTDTTKCTSLTELSFPNWENAEKLTSMNGMFTKCPNLRKVSLPKLSKLDALTNMSNMFSGLTSLEEVDLTGFTELSSVTTMENMFNNCSNLKVIYVSQNWGLESVTNSSNLFNNCSNLVGGAGTPWTNAHKQDIAYARIDHRYTEPGYFTKKNAYWIESGGRSLAVEVGKTLGVGDIARVITVYQNSNEVQLATLTTTTYEFIANDDKLSVSDKTITGEKTGESSITVSIGNDTSVDIKVIVRLVTSEQDAVVIGPALRLMMQGEMNTKGTFDHASGLTAKITDMTEAQLREKYGLNTKHTANLYMNPVTAFERADNLPDGIDVNKLQELGWTDNQNGETGHFYAWTETKDDKTVLRWWTDAKTVYLPRDCKDLFQYCRDIEYFDLSEEYTKVKFSAEKTVDMTGMFADCSSMKYIDLSCVVDTPVLTATTDMFHSCVRCIGIDLTNWSNSPKLKYIRSMFRYCTSMEYVDISNLVVYDPDFKFDSDDYSTDNWVGIQNCQQMFDDDSSLKWVKFGKHVALAPYATEMADNNGAYSQHKGQMSIFKDCPSLQWVDLTGYDTRNVQPYKEERKNKGQYPWGIGSMFLNCGNLETVYVSEWWEPDNFYVSTEDEYKEDTAFSGCSSKLTGGEGTSKKDSDLDYALIDGGASSKGYFTYKKNVESKFDTIIRYETITQTTQDIYAYNGTEDLFNYSEWPYAYAIVIYTIKETDANKLESVTLKTATGETRTITSSVKDGSLCIRLADYKNVGIDSITFTYTDKTTETRIISTDEKKKDDPDKTTESSSETTSEASTETPTGEDGEPITEAPEDGSTPAVTTAAPEVHEDTSQRFHATLMVKIYDKSNGRMIYYRDGQIEFVNLTNLSKDDIVSGFKGKNDDGLLTPETDDDGKTTYKLNTGKNLKLDNEYWNEHDSVYIRIKYLE